MHLKPPVAGVIHFIGIGGIGMSGIADILHAQGYKVQGSDSQENKNTIRLRQQGIPVYIGHEAANVKDANIVILSTAIKNTNIEYQTAKAKGIPLVHRADMLAELMRLKPSIAVSGSHGKTTTTSLIGHLLDAVGAEPTIITGGIINTFGTNARLGTGEWMVVEADESDGSFTRLPAVVSILTSLDAEHLDHYGSYENLQQAFRQFLLNLPFYGLGIVCHDDMNLRPITDAVQNRRILKYGLLEGADVQATNISFAGTHSHFDVKLFHKAKLLRGAKEQDTLSNMVLPMLGEHNIQNALAAIIVCLELGISYEQIRLYLKTFGGVARRFTETGRVQGVVFIDDYAHHPQEIQKVLKSARLISQGKVIAIAQPHRYTRLRDLFKEFTNSFQNADYIIITPVYAAGEQAIEGYNHHTLAQAITEQFPSKHVAVVEGYAQLPALLATLVQPEDYAIFLGAGSITEWAHNIVKDIAPHLSPATQMSQAY